MGTKKKSVVFSIRLNPADLDLIRCEAVRRCIPPRTLVRELAIAAISQEKAAA